MFIAYVKQAGEGCDYTIGCAQTLWRLKSNTYTEALAELHHKIIGEWLPDDLSYEEGYWNEFRLKSVVMFEVTQEESIPVNSWYDEALTFQMSERKRANDDAERAEFERLKKKYA